MNTPDNRKKILIVNYDDELTDSLRLFLCKKGYVVYTASVIEQIFEIAFKKRKTIEYILLEAEHLDGTYLSEKLLENQKHPVLEAIFFWQALFKECCLPPFKLVMFQPRDIPGLVQKLDQEGKQLCQRNPDNLNDVVKLMKAQLAKEQLCERQLAKKIENSIREKHRILEHGKQPANLAPMTKDARYLFYALAICFQIRHQLRFLILDNAWDRKDNLKAMFDRLGIHTGVVGVSEKLDPPNYSANYTYFVDFKDFDNLLKKEGLDVRRENWGEDIRKIFNPSLLNQSQHFCFDGIVLDIFLIDEDDETKNNKYDGIDILQALKNDNKYHQREGGLDNIPIIMLTALGDEWHIIESINKKADWYIPKYKYDNELIESIKDIPVAFYRLYLKRWELQELFIKIFEVVCDIEENLKDHKKIKRKRLDRLQEGLKEFRQDDIPSFLFPFFESLDKIANKCKDIIAPGLEQEDWVEVKNAGESILDELDKISKFNDVCCFENYEKYQEYLKQGELEGEVQGRDRASIPFISRKLNSKGKSEQPSLLSKHVHDKVTDIIKSANAHIRRLPIQRASEIV